MGHFVMVPLNLTCLQCLQHSFVEHHFNLYYNQTLLSQCMMKSITNLDFLVLTYICCCKQLNDTKNSVIVVTLVPLEMANLT